jgi:hypothetical protein
MKLSLFLKRLSPAAVLVALVALTVGGGAAAAAPEAGTAAACKPAKNVEAIIDDSGSMSSEDPAKFRTALLSAFANIGTNSGLVFGGIEFGTSPNTLFGPATIPGVNTAMEASFAQVDADNGTTDYQEAFAAGVAHNGAADARVFLTDGNPDSYPTSHLSPRVKTYVIGIGDFAASAGGNAVLSQLAAETGGPAPFLIVDSSQVQPVAGAITAAINCKKPPLTFVKTFTKQGQQVTYAFKPQGKTADVLVTWGNAATSLDPIAFSAQGGGKSAAASVVAWTAGKKGKKGRAKVKVKKKSGATFVTVKLKGLKKGKKIKFKVKAKRLTTATVGTTQVIR